MTWDYVLAQIICLAIGPVTGLLIGALLRRDHHNGLSNP